MRSIIAVIIAALSVSLVLTGCGGGAAKTDTASTTPAAGGVVSPPPAASVTTSGSTDRSPVQGNYPAPFPTVTTETAPVALRDSLAAGDSILIAFYDSSQVVTADEKAEVNAVMKKYRGLIELVSFDLSKSLAAAGGTSDATLLAHQGANLAGLLGVTYMPYIVLVDGTGQITYRASGFVDRGLLEREVLRATE